MRVVRDWRNGPAEFRGAVAPIGNFDGVHRGHRALIAQARSEAAKSGAPVAAIVFEPHPVEFFKPGGPSFRLTPFDAKARLLAAEGLDVLFVLRFDAELAAMPPGAFVGDVLADGLGIGAVIVGADFRFGKGRAGTVETLRAEGGKRGIAVLEAATVEAEPGQKVSSTRIRTALKEGRPRDAAHDLGHWWTVEGHVADGDRRGRTIGFPTANLALRGTMEPALGVYAVRVTLEEGGETRIYDGVANFGRRPTFDKTDVLLEVHLFDFAGDLYGKRIAVAFIDYVRAERKFPGLDALKAQIAADCETAKRILAAIA